MVYRAARAVGDDKRASAIRSAANKKLWMSRKGWFAESRDPEPESSLHESACLYSVNAPIITGLADAFQARQILQYAQHELEQVTFPNHPGRLCWLSQWVPWVYSIREMGHGENLSLALACFLAGDAELGWDYFQGALFNSQYDSVIPGAIQCESWVHKRAPHFADFAHVVSLYLRTLSRGLAGFRPEPNGPFRWEPTFPPDWRHADLQFPRHGVKWQRERGRDHWVFRQSVQGPLELVLPVPGCRDVIVDVNGKPTRFEPVVAMGSPKIRITLPPQERCEVVVTAKDEVRALPASHDDLRVGQAWTCQVGPKMRLLELFDPQGVLEQPILEPHQLRGTIRGEPGHRLLFVQVAQGEVRWWQPLELTIPDRTDKTAAYVPQHPIQSATPRMCNLTPHVNGTLRSLCDRVCVEPRPQTCGSQISIDGFSSWLTAPRGAPSFDTAAWHAGAEPLVAHNIPFRRPTDAARDALLVSRWSHLPRQVEIPLQQRVERLYLLVGLNTNFMQSHREVLRLTVHGDSSAQRFPLIYPRDVLSSLHTYDPVTDRSCLPSELPRQIELGHSFRATVLEIPLVKPTTVERITWECVARETIGALLAISMG